MNMRRLNSLKHHYRTALLALFPVYEDTATNWTNSTFGEIEVSGDIDSVGCRTKTFKLVCKKLKIPFTTRALQAYLDGLDMELVREYK